MIFARISLIIYFFIRIFRRNAFTIENCPASGLIDTEHDGVLPYPDIYFSELSGSTDFQELNVTYECNSEWDMSHRDRRDINITIEKCLPKLCPIHLENIASSISALTWPYKLHSLCTLHKHNFTSIHRKSARVIVLGGSMTRGVDIAGQCCRKRTKCSSSNVEDDFSLRSDKYYCNWTGFYSRWLRDKYQNANISVYNFGTGGASSDYMGKELPLFLQENNISELSSSDIVFVDFSANDRGYANLEGFEYLVRQLFQLAKRTLPTIIIMETYHSFSSFYRGNSGNISYNRHKSRSIDNLYVTKYRKVAEYYNLPLFSFFEVVWSKFAVENQFRLIDITTSYALHSPWHTHLFIADFLAGFTMKLLEQCDSRVHAHIATPGTHLPKPLGNIKTDVHHSCDLDQPLLIKVKPSSTFHPENITDYELKNVTSWTDYIDHHNKPGFIINKFALPENRWLNISLPADLSTFLANSSAFNDTVSTNTSVVRPSFLLRVNFLRSYKDAGRVSVFLCGKRIDRLDALFKHFNRKVSIPQLWTSRVSVDALKICVKGPEASRYLHIEYEGADDPDGLFDERLNFKFKIYSIVMCVSK